LKKIFLLIIFLHQKIFTLFDFGSCRYYPTCSQYAKINIQHNNIFIALFYSTKRILSCNQLFDGGIDYPIINNKIINNYISIYKYKSFFNLNNIQSWLVNKNNNEVYWISNFTKKS
jgi:putative membrane protein insertion efficiency factor